MIVGIAGYVITAALITIIYLLLVRPARNAPDAMKGSRPL